MTREWVVEPAGSGIKALRERVSSVCEGESMAHWKIHAEEVWTASFFYL